jgi:hypothetical protein
MTTTNDAPCNVELSADQSRQILCSIAGLSLADVVWATDVEHALARQKPGNEADSRELVALWIERIYTVCVLNATYQRNVHALAQELERLPIAEPHIDILRDRPQRLHAIYGHNTRAASDIVISSTSRSDTCEPLFTTVRSDVFKATDGTHVVALKRARMGHNQWIITSKVNIDSCTTMYVLMITRPRSV